MSLIRHYWVLPWATGLLTLLESITKVPDRQVAKTSKSSIFWLFSFSWGHISGWSFYNDSDEKRKRHKSLGTALTTYCDHSTRTILQWFSSTPMLILSTICHFVRTTFFIACKAPARSSTRHLFTYGMHFVYNTSSTEIFMVMWHSVYKKTRVGGSL